MTGGAALWRYRSILFVPGDRPDRYVKALAAGADAVCIDLEDAVAPARREAARGELVRFLAGGGAASGPGDQGRGGPGGRGAAGPGGQDPAAPHLLVRVNDLASDAGWRDIEAISGAARLDGVMVPMVRAAEQVERAARRLGGEVAVLPLIETARGLEEAVGIGAVPGVAGLVFGGFDLALELGAKPAWEPLLYARSRVVHAAAVNRVPAYDVPSRDFRDLVGLREEAVRARGLGFAGKTAIHPAQIPVIHEVFAPTRGEVERARAIVEADRGAGGGAVGVGGRMVDRPVVEAARRVLARAGEALHAGGKPEGAGG